MGDRYWLKYRRFQWIGKTDRRISTVDLLKRQSIYCIDNRYTNSGFINVATIALTTDLWTVDFAFRQ